MADVTGLTDTIYGNLKDLGLDAPVSELPLEAGKYQNGVMFAPDGLQKDPERIEMEEIFLGPFAPKSYRLVTEERAIWQVWLAYFAWTSSLSGSGTANDNAFSRGDASSVETVVSVAPCPEKGPSVAPENVVKVYLAGNVNDTELVGTSIKLLIMGFFHPVSVETAPTLEEIHEDMAIAYSLLERPGLDPDETLEQVKSSTSSWSDKYVRIRSFGRQHVDRVPMHRAGNRVDSIGLRDKDVGKGGLCVLK